MIKTLLDVDSAVHIWMDCATIVELTDFGKHEFPACAGVDRATIEALPIQRGRGVRNAVFVGPDDRIAGMHNLSLIQTFVNTIFQLAPGSIAPLSKLFPSNAVAVCGMLSLLVQMTVSPGCTICLLY